jgi:hypothetical protein
MATLALGKMFFPIQLHACVGIFSKLVRVCTDLVVRD